MLFLIGFSLLKYLFASLVSTQMAAPGLGFFSFISYLNLFFITVLGVTLFSSAITEEKEVDSLNLLLMTGLTPFTMLISKSTSKLLIGLMLIFAQLPFSILSVTLGGVSMHQVFSVYVTLFAYTFLVCNLALFFSVICQRTYKAATMTLLILLVFHMLTMFLPAISAFSPFVRTSKILTTGFKGSVWGEQAISNLAIAIFLFIISVLIFNFFTRTSTAPGPIRLPRKGNRNRLFKLPRAWDNAIAWKEFFFTVGGTVGFIASSLLLIFFVAAGILAASFQSQVKIEDVGTGLLIIGLVFFILKCVYMSSTIFNREMEEKTYSLLSLLPISIGKIAYSKILGGSLFLLPSIITIFIGILFATDFLENLQLNTELIGFVSVVLSGLVEFVFYLYLVTFFSLRVRYGGFVVALLLFFVINIGLGIPGLMISMISFIPFGIFGNSATGIFFIINSLITIGIYSFAIIFTNRLIIKRLEELAAA